MDGHKGKFTGKCSEDESQNTRNQNQSLKSMSSHHNFSIDGAQEMLYNYLNKILSFSNIHKLHITANQS